MKKKVLFVIDSLGCGGAEKSLVSLLPLIDSSKFDIDLLAFNRGGAFENLVPENVNFIGYSLPKLKRFLAGKIYSLAWRLNKSHHGAETRWKTMHWAYPKIEKKYDVAVAYQQGLPTYFVAEKVNAARKFAWVNVDIVKAGYDLDFNRHYYNQYTNVIGVSDTVSKQLYDQNFVESSKIVTVLDILNVDLIKKMSEEQTDSKFVKEALTIVTTGRLAPQKNHILAVKTADLLAKQGLNFKWFFVGDGSERDRIEALIREKNLSDKVILLGMKTNPYPYMAGADIYVQTSSFEGFGLTLTEARLLHKPVVSTNFPVVYDQITPGINGLVSEMTPESLSENILSLVNDASLRETIIAGTKKEINLTAQTESAKVNELFCK